MQGRGTVEPDEDRLEDGIAFAGVAKFPARVKCALLGWSAFKDAAARALSEHELTEHAAAPDRRSVMTSELTAETHDRAGDAAVRAGPGRPARRERRR